MSAQSVVSPRSVAAQGSARATGPPGARFYPEVGPLPWIEDPVRVAPCAARELTRQFLDRLSVLEEGTPEHQYARGTLIEMNQSLVRFVARRYRNRGSGEMEDIRQVGMIGLIKAIDRFDLSRKAEFTSFAIPYISGEIRRFFRDATWAVHVPRRLQELRTDLTKAQDALSTTLDRRPNATELSGRMHVSKGEVEEAMIAANGYTAGSLDTRPHRGEAAGEGRPLTETRGACDPQIELIDNLRTLRPLMDRLDERQRRILDMRFVQEMTQAEIGTKLGYSQMHISRILKATLATLRAGMLCD